MALGRDDARMVEALADYASVRRLLESGSNPLAARVERERIKADLIAELRRAVACEAVPHCSEGSDPGRLAKCKKTGASN